MYNFVNHWWRSSDRNVWFYQVVDPCYDKQINLQSYECCLLSLKVIIAYARDWLQFAKSILSAESARSLGLRLRLRDYSSSALTLSEFQLERLSQSTLVDLCKTWGIGISYSLSMLSLANSHYKILCHGCAKLVQAVEHEQALLFLEWTGGLHQETCPCLHITTCQRLCTRPHP